MTDSKQWLLCLPLMIVPSSPASAPGRHLVRYADVQIEVVTEGDGPLIVLLPSLGRDADDYVLGRRQDKVFLELKELLEPFGVSRFFNDDWGAYERHLDLETHVIGKRNTQQIERKHPTLRTRIKRLARNTIYFSKSAQMHDIVTGLFVNRYEFDLGVLGKDQQS